MYLLILVCFCYRPIRRISTRLFRAIVDRGQDVRVHDPYEGIQSPLNRSCCRDYESNYDDDDDDNDEDDDDDDSADGDGDSINEFMVNVVRERFARLGIKMPEGHFNPFPMD